MKKCQPTEPFILSIKIRFTFLEDSGFGFWYKGSILILRAFYFHFVKCTSSDDFFMSFISNVQIPSLLLLQKCKSVFLTLHIFTLTF